jgi:hypothetical protein
MRLLSLCAFFLFALVACSKSNDTKTATPATNARTNTPSQSSVGAAISYPYTDTFTGVYTITASDLQTIDSTLPLFFYTTHYSADSMVISGTHFGLLDNGFQMAFYSTPLIAQLALTPGQTFTRVQFSSDYDFYYYRFAYDSLSFTISYQPVCAVPVLETYSGINIHRLQR